MPRPKSRFLLGILIFLLLAACAPAAAPTKTSTPALTATLEVSRYALPLPSFEDLKITGSAMPGFGGPDTIVTQFPLSLGLEQFLVGKNWKPVTTANYLASETFSSTTNPDSHVCTIPALPTIGNSELPDKTMEFMGFKNGIGQYGDSVDSITPISQLLSVFELQNFPEGTQCVETIRINTTSQTEKAGELMLTFIIPTENGWKILAQTPALIDAKDGSVTFKWNETTKQPEVLINGKPIDVTLMPGVILTTPTPAPTETLVPTETPAPTETQPAEKPFVALEDMNTVEDCAINELPNPVTEPEKFQIAYEKWMQNSQDWYNDPANKDIRAEAKLLSIFQQSNSGILYNNVITGKISRDIGKIYPSCATIDGYNAYIYDLPALIKNNSTGKTEVVHIGFFSQIPEFSILAEALGPGYDPEQTFADFHGDGDTGFGYFNPPLTDEVVDWSNILDPETVTKFTLTRELVKQLFADTDNDYGSAIKMIAQGKADTNAIAAFRNSCNRRPIPIDINFFLKKK
jgi:hypothetical protein